MKLITWTPRKNSEREAVCKERVWRVLREENGKVLIDEPLSGEMRWIAREQIKTVEAY